MPPLDPSSPPASPRLAAVPSSVAETPPLDAKIGIVRRRVNGRANDDYAEGGTDAGVATTTLQPGPAVFNSGCHRRISNGLDHKKQLSYRLGKALSGPSRAIAPIAIIGGTYSVYSSAVKLSSGNNSATQFTPVSILYLILLALNYAIMPRLSKRYIHPSTNKQSVALVEEVVKMGLGIGGWVATSYATASNANGMDGDGSATSTISIISRQLQSWSPLSTLVAAGLPSALYALQGTLTYHAYQNLDPVTFNGITQLKVLSSALCCYIVLGKRQSRVQLLSLGILIMSTIIIQGSWKDWAGSVGKMAKLGSNDNGRSRHNQLVRGVLPCISATLLSGLAGAFSQRSLQTQVGMMHRDAYFYTAEISLLSAMCLLLSMGLEFLQGRSYAPTHVKKCDDLEKSDSGFFRNWTCATLLPITTKAMAGLLTALVHRHLGSVIKGFALVLGLVFSALLQFGLEGIDLNAGQLVGTALVLLSSWLHFTNPSVM